MAAAPSSSSPSRVFPRRNAQRASITVDAIPSRWSFRGSSLVFIILLIRPPCINKRGLRLQAGSHRAIPISGT